MIFCSTISPPKGLVALIERNTAREPLRFRDSSTMNDRHEPRIRISRSGIRYSYSASEVTV
jgi:hypothetical protein